MLLAEYTQMSKADVSSWLTTVAKHHKFFIGVVQSFGEDRYAEDIVQEMYLRIYKYTDEEKIVKNGEVNKGFIWFVLRNIYVDYCKQKGRIEKIELNEATHIFEEDDINTNRARSAIDNKIEDEINSWHWYDKMVFKLYKEKGHSLREMSSLTKISVTSIFHTIKHCKERLAENIGEDYEDYLNGDYELL